MNFVVDLMYFKGDKDNWEMVDSGQAVNVEHSVHSLDDDREMLHKLLDEMLDGINENPDVNKSHDEAGIMIKVK